MQLIPTHEQSDLQAAVRRSMHSGETRETVRAALDTDASPYDGPRWRRRCEQMGIAGLLIPDAQGGAGAGMMEAAIVAGELGAALSGEPFIATTAALDTLLAVDGERDDDLVTRLADGSAVAGVQMAPHRLQLDAAGSTVSGVLPHVLDADGAHVLVAHVDGGAVIIDPDAGSRTGGGMHVERLRGLDLSRRTSRVQLERVPHTFLPIARAELERLHDRRGVLLAADSLGIMRAMLDSTAEYAKTRTAFGRTIGSFQGVKHQLADIFCTLERAHALVLAAAWASDAGDPSTRRLALLAQRVVLPAAVEATTECLRLLGGIGYTWEHDAHLQVRRAAANLALATPQHEVDRALAKLLEI